MHQLADDEQRPAVAHEIEGMCHRTVLLVALRHAERIPLDNDSEESTCKTEVDAVTVARHDFRNASNVGSVDRPPQVAGSRPPVRGPVHGGPRHRDRERRAPLHQDRPRVLPGRPPVGDQRLRARVRRVPPAGWPRRRHAGAPPHLPGRHRRVHRGLAAGRPRLVGAVPDRRPRLPGARRRDHHAGRPLDPVHDVRRRSRAQHRAGRLGRGRRLRRRGGRAPRRSPHRRPQLGVDLLRQRPGRRRRLRAGSAAAAGEP